MPNTGKPSKDCHLCRSRRVKCDLTRPACQRCIKYGVDCPGYRNEQELVFRNANPANLKKRKKRAKELEDGGDHQFSSETSSSERSVSTPRMTSDDAFNLLNEFNDDPFLAFSDAIDLIPSSYASAYHAPVPALTRPIFEHWTDHSVPILLNVYSTVDFLRNIYRSNDRDGPLVWAAHLFSRTYVTNVRYPTSVHKQSEEETQRELGTYLGKTLSSVSLALKSPGGPLRDDVLATVWILANYELLIGSIRRTEHLSPWHLHAKGLYSILKARGTAPLRTSRGRTAFWPAYSMVQIQSLISSTPCPQEADEWFAVIKEELYDGEALSLNISIFIGKICDLVSRIITVLYRRNFAAADDEYAGFQDELDAAEKEINDFYASKNDQPHELDPFMNNMYQSALLKCYHIFQLLVNFLTHYPASRHTMDELRAKRVQCLMKIRTAAQSILDSTPVAIGPLAQGKDKSPKVLFDALKLIWPLSAVYVIPTTLPEQTLQAQSALLFIGSELGVKQALHTYPTGSMMPIEADKPLGDDEYM